MKNFAVIVLAAGKGVRMKSVMPKVLFPVCGRPMLYYPVKAASELGAKKIIVVVGHDSERVKEALRDKSVKFVLQTPQLGTGHAVMAAMKELKGFRGDVLILSGDVPLITKETINALLKIHQRPDKPSMTFISTLLNDPKGYGRIIRDKKGKAAKIVEDKDLKPVERAICEVNAGIYLCRADFLRKNLKRLKRNNRQKEYYLPDLVEIAYKKGVGAACFTHINAEEVMGINTRVELARANATMRKKIITSLMLDGVTVVDPETTYMDYGVKVGMDSTISPYTHLLGNTAVGKNCVIQEGVRINDSVIGNGSIIKSFSIVESSRIGKDVTIGPFARIRPESEICDNARIGNFVEVKKSWFGRGAKANHLSYIGDSTVGKDVNIGAGVITCNYDGFKKHRTVIEDGAFIGSDSQLIAPVKVGKNAYIGSGSTITKNVPKDSLALSRAQEKIIKGWVKRKKKKG